MTVTRVITNWRDIDENMQGSALHSSAAMMADKRSEDVLGALLLEEIDIEIGLRARLKETVESRLTWALILQESLEKQCKVPEAPGGKDAPNHFADLALATYQATRESSEILLPKELPESLNIQVNPNIAPQRIDSSHATVPDVPRPRRPHVQLHHEDRVVKEPNKYLFLRDVTATPTMVYKIACPDCHRSDFPRLQGLLNHCRLKHHREFGSHDECVQACAIVVPEEDQAYVIEHGLEVLGMSASLQRLFKMAVGAYEGIIAVPEAEGAKELAKVVQFGTLDEAEESEPSTFVTKTLGHHKETPALAPFLGRAPQKRHIHIFESDVPLDILSVENHAPRLKWTMHSNARSSYNQNTDENEACENEGPGSTDGTLSPKGRLNARDGSRFHIPVRLIISDYSLHLPNDEPSRSERLGKVTHKWMISVSTASYSFHVSTVLSRMTVTSATDSVLPSSEITLSIIEPPFCILSTTDKPFLARIVLDWVGTRNKPTEVEHWVQLTSISARPVKGDEQVLDIELDRHTEVLPRKKDAWAVNWSSNDYRSTRESKAIESSNGAESEDIKCLKILLERFPMTAQDSGCCKLPQVPYFLPLTVQHLESLVEGRRKAIEWGRARAIWETYGSSRIGTDAFTHRNASSETSNKFSAPIDVYRWMAKEGHFLGIAHQSRERIKPRPINDIICGTCGLRASLHRRGKGWRLTDAEDGALACAQPSWTGVMPIIDAQDFRTQQAQTGKRRVPSEQLNGAYIGLIQMTDPALILGVQRTVSVLQLSRFHAPQPPISSGIVSIKERRTDEFAPYAALAIAVRALLRLLVQVSVQAMETKVEGAPKPSALGPSGSKRFLVPSHLLRGLVESARKKGNREAHRALLLSLARLGITLHDIPPVTESDRS